MALDGINSIGNIRQIEDRKIEQEAKARPQADKSQKTSESDLVEVTSGTTAQLKTQISLIPDVRSDKIEEIQKAIVEGNYKVPSEDIASIILEELV